MLGAQEQRRLVAQLSSAIEAERNITQQDLMDAMQGTIQQPCFIDRMERVSHLHQELGNLVGPSVATAMIADMHNQGH